jgi:hypothetical protein
LNEGLRDNVSLLMADPIIHSPDADVFRKALGHFATGVTVVTVDDGALDSRNDCECIYFGFARSTADTGVHREEG